MNVLTSSRRRPTLSAGLLAAVAVAALGAGVAKAAVLSETLPALPAGTALGLEQAEPFLEAPSGSGPDLPADPKGALIDAIGSLSKEMGRPTDATVAVVEAALSPDVAGNIALVLHDMLRCQRITKAHMARIGPSVLKEAVKENGNGGGLNPSDFNDIRPCAQALWKSANHLQKALAKAVLAAGRELDVWPVIRYDRSKADNTYRHDYALLIDGGGDDTYNNNAGSNVIDVNYGPPGQPGLVGEGPAVGCARAVAGIAPDLESPAEDFPDCIASVGVLLDLGGDDSNDRVNDRYGVKQTPTVDAECTKDLVVRRMLTNGVGFLGVGMLIDRGGNDVYTGKTVSNGAGHLFGVGVLHDEAGNDTYLAVRNSTGFGLFGGLGVLRDHAGNDVHDFYMPSPRDASLEGLTKEQPGAGGVIDDVDMCDNRPRYNVGGGNLAATGVALDDAGDDRYTGGLSTTFEAPGGNQGGGGSQGFANNGATGLLVDRGRGRDTYKIVTLEKVASDGTWLREPYAPAGARRRDDDITLLPEIDPDTREGKETGTGGVFHDG